MDADWQTWAAAAVVIATAALFTVRAMRRKKGGCAGCGASPSPPRKR